MSEAEDYTVLDTQYPADAVKWEVRDGRLYCDGVPVPKWQLTSDELKKYFPEDYLAEFGIEPIPCPLPGDGAEPCGMMNNAYDRRGFLAHARNAHKEWYDRNFELMKKLGETRAIFDAIKAGRDIK